MPEPMAPGRETPAVGYDYEAIGAEGAAPRGVGVSGSTARRAVAAGVVGVAMALCVVAAVGEGGNPLALGIEKLTMGRMSTEQYLQNSIQEGLVIGEAPAKKVKYFSLGQDPAVGSQSSDWGYSGAKGPSDWATVAPEFASCASGQMQSPVNIVRDDAKAHLNLPPLRWQGFEAEPFSGGVSETHAFYDGHSICLGGPFAGKLGGPRLAVHGFSRYLPDLPLDKVALVNYTLKEMRFHTPAEHQIDGVTYPFEMQMVHECNPQTEPPCTINKTMIVSVMFTEAKTGWGEKSPDFITSLLEDLHLIEGVWSQYVASYAFDFGKVASTINMYASRYFLMKGSLTVPPCTEDVTWYVIKDQLAISASDLKYAKKIMGQNTRPLQPWNDRVIFSVN